MYMGYNLGNVVEFSLALRTRWAVMALVSVTSQILGFGIRNIIWILIIKFWLKIIERIIFRKVGLFFL